MPVIPIGPIPVTTPSIPPTTTNALYDLAVSTDLVLGPSGDISIVAGKSAFLQHLLMVCETPQGALYYDPEYGDGLAGLIGKTLPQQSQTRGYVQSLVAIIQALGTNDGVGTPTITTSSVITEPLSGTLTLNMDVSFGDGTTQTLNTTVLQG